MEKIKILGVEYKIIYVDSVDAVIETKQKRTTHEIQRIPETDAKGYCTFTDKKIYIKKGEDNLTETVLHEINHAILGESALDEVIPPHIQELICTIFARVYLKELIQL